MLSPTFRVREFHVHDINHYSTKAHWTQNPAEPSEDTELVLFPRGNGIPSTKVLTFYRKESFDVESSYDEPGTLPGGVNPWIARLTAKAVTLDGKEAEERQARLDTPVFICQLCFPGIPPISIFTNRGHASPPTAHSSC